MENDHSIPHDKRVGDALTAGGRISLVQFEGVRKAAEADGVHFETEPLNGPPLHIWQRDHIMVRRAVDEKQDDTLRRLGAVLVATLDDGKQEDSGNRVKLLRLDKLGDRSIREVIEGPNLQRSAGEQLFLNNLVYVADGEGANICPADEPSPVRNYPHTIPYPPANHGDAGLGIQVAVIDTGLSQDWQIRHPWLYDGDRQPPTEVTGDPEKDTFGTDNRIQPHAGHGTFIAGIIRCVAPRTTVSVSNTMRWAGAMTEFEVARSIIATLDANPALDIISLSAGCTIPAIGPGPRAMLDVLNRLRQPGCNTLLVAAAGNDGSRTNLFYPAAFAAEDPFAADDLVVAVGALRQDRLGRACFSNCGEWVTLYEDGEKLVNAFPTGKFGYSEPLSTVRPPQCVYHSPSLEDGCTCVTAPAEGTVVHFRGMAAWSGTSFATPIVVGRVIRHMSAHAQFAHLPRVAMKDLLKQLSVIEDAGDSLDLRIFPQPVSG